MRIATFNVNGIRARLPRLLEWLDAELPDVVVLQEIKIQDKDFPFLEFESRGWHLEVHGQKSFNGVAILARHPINDVMRGLPGDDTDEQARYIEGTVNGVRICGLYLPNGNPRPGPKFDYKLAWMDRLIARARHLLTLEIPVVMLGDYNVCPEDIDVYDPAGWVDDALTNPASRARFRTLLNMGYLDAIRHFQPSGKAYTFWDYQAGAWAKDMGLRIDHALLNAQAADIAASCHVDRAPRGKEQPSDHTPVILTLSSDF